MPSGRTFAVVALGFVFAACGGRGSDPSVAPTPVATPSSPSTTPTPTPAPTPAWISFSVAPVTGWISNETPFDASISLHRSPGGDCPVVVHAESSTPGFDPAPESTTIDAGVDTGTIHFVASDLPAGSRVAYSVTVGCIGSPASWRVVSQAYVSPIPGGPDGFLHLGPLESFGQWNHVATDDSNLFVNGSFQYQFGDEPQYGLAVARLNATGALDEGYGVHGIAATPGFGPAYGYVPATTSDFAVDREHRVLAVGPALIDGNDGTLLARFDAGGFTDPSFGSGGMLSLPELNGARLALLPDESILVFGISREAGEPKLFRVERDGSHADLIDNSAWWNGERNSHFSVAINGDGTPIIALDGHLFGISWDGSLGSSFDAKADVFVEPKIDSTGSILALAFTSSTHRCDIYRFYPDGSVDESFGDYGRLALTMSGTALLPNRDDAGFLVAGNYAGGDGMSSYARVDSYDSAGNPVGSYSAGSIDEIDSLAMDPLGRLFVGFPGGASCLNCSH